MAIGIAWLWSTAPETASSIYSSLNAGHVLFILVLAVAGLLVATWLWQILSSLLQVLFQMLKVAVVTLAIAGGVYLWQNPPDISVPVEIQPRTAEVRSFVSSLDSVEHTVASSAHVSRQEADQGQPWWSN